PQFDTSGAPLPPRALGVEEIVAADLTDFTRDPDWTLHPGAAVAVDPVLGRLRFRDPQPIRGGAGVPPLAPFHYGLAMGTGGGEYRRIQSFDPTARPVERVTNLPLPGVPGASTHSTMTSALGALPTDGGVIEIVDSGVYTDSPVLGAARRLEIRAAER